MNEEHVLKGAFEGIKFGPRKHREFSAVPIVYPKVARVHLNKRHARDPASVSKENNQCTSQHTIA